MDELAVARREVAVWRNRFRALFDRTPAPTAICSIRGELTSVNPAFARLFGVSPGRLLAREITTLLRPVAEREFVRVVTELERGKRSRRALRMSWSGAGIRHTARVTVQPVHDEDGIALLVTIDPDSAVDDAVPVLSDREAQVLRASAQGKTSAAIATELGMTTDGVSYYLTRLTRRLEVANRVALVARAYTLGLLDAEEWPPR
ncbi:LuxR C-terminal-related transcriptional regulator [Sciscionella marina]|uniref:helix-turn-helix transcriptional regulator n=1 Tax=Sciscionella marina TaxID=508770 RepID=UPI00036388A9|nr:LuxR C-terminal-related transcriptional regulator [Sciscionella marina]